MRRATVTVRTDEGPVLGLEGVLAAFHEADLRDVEVVSCAGPRAVVRATVAATPDEDRLADSPAVRWYERVADPGPGHAYLLAVDSSDAPGAASCDEDILECGPTDVDESAVTVDLAGPQSAISSTVEGYEDAGATVTLETLRDYERSPDPLEELTPRQREVVRTAAEAGYFEIPREASTADVAAELDLDDSTVAEHLQRAERNLLAALLD